MAGAFGPTGSAINITTATVVRKCTDPAAVTAPGVIFTLIVTTAGSATGTVADTDAAGSVAAANTFFSIPNTVGIYKLEFPFYRGLVVTPGTDQVVSVSYR